MQWTPEIRPCPVCGESKYKTLGKRGGEAHRDKLGTETTIVRCSKCSATYARPFMIPNGNPYGEPDEYFANHDEHEKIAMSELIAERFEKILGYTGTMLDVGCGRGEALQGFANRGWEAKGIEMTKSYADIARSRGYEVEEAPVEESKFLDEGNFDVVMLAGILEHCYAPVDVLKQVNKGLKSGGYLFIDVPNEAALSLSVGNLYQKLRGRDWSINLSPTFSPFHVVGFTPKSLKLALHQTGFEMSELFVPEYTNSLPKGIGLIRSFEHLAMSAMLKVGAKIGRGDGLVCWARKV